MKAVRSFITGIMVIFALFGALVTALLILWATNPQRPPAVNVIAQGAIDAGRNEIKAGAANVSQRAHDALATTFPSQMNDQHSASHQQQKPENTQQQVAQADIATSMQQPANSSEVAANQSQQQVAPVDTLKSANDDASQAQLTVTDTTEPLPTQAPPTQQPPAQNGRRTRTSRAPVQLQAAIADTPMPQAQAIVDTAVRQPSVQQQVIADTPQAVQPPAVNPQQIAGSVAQALDVRADPLRIDNTHPEAMTLTNGSEVLIIPQQNWCNAVTSRSAIASAIDPNPIVEPRALELVGHAYSLKMKGQAGLWQEILDYSMQCPGVTDRSQTEKDIYAMVTGR